MEGCTSSNSEGRDETRSWDTVMMKMKAGLQSLFTKLDEPDTQKSMDLFIWGVMAGAVGTIAIMIYVFAVAQQ